MSKKPNNILLGKTELGQVKKGFHQLPEQGHTYGYAPKKDRQGARDVISSWEEGTKSSSKQGGKNYVAMNREGVRNGCVDSKQFSEFRKQNEIKVKIKEGQKFYGLKIPDEEFTYGIPNKPSTPIKNVICNNYAESQEEMRQEREAVMKMLQSDNKKKHSAVVQVSPKKPHEEIDRRKELEANNFKLSKFKNVPSKIKPLIDKNRA